MQKTQPIKFLKLPFIFDENKMAQEVNKLLNEHWVPHFNTAGYKGNWNSISLYAPGGKATNIHALQNEPAALKATPALQNAVYLKEVLSHFKAPFVSVRLLRLEAGAFIKPHRDHELGYEDGCFRIHIPVDTHNKIEFLLDNELVTMLPGECWYTNVNYVHSVANNGTSDRIHLVIDLKRNHWSDKIFFSLAPKESFFPEPEEKHNIETQHLILEELKRMDSPVALELISKIEQQFQK
jgi:hypothetical protein